LLMSFWAQDRGRKVVSTATEDVRRETPAWPNTNRRRHHLPTFGLPYACTDPRAAPMAPTQQNGVQSGVRPMACCTLRSRPRGVEHCRRGPDVYVPYVLRASVRWSCSASQVSERRTRLHPSNIPSDSRCPRAVRCPRSAQRPSLMSRHIVQSEQYFLSRSQEDGPQSDGSSAAARRSSTGRRGCATAAILERARLPGCADVTNIN